MTEPPKPSDSAEPFDAFEFLNVPKIDDGDAANSDADPDSANAFDSDEQAAAGVPPRRGTLSASVRIGEYDGLGVLICAVAGFFTFVAAPVA